MRETVILNNHDGSRFTGVVAAARPPRPITRLVSPDAGLADCVDEGLIVFLVLAVGNRQRLSAGLLREARRPRVGHPDLQGAQPALPQTCAMPADLVT